ncbi:MAG TPA: CDP-diacylglycerol--glycerol-3-phosphate 3-phosphatidyltransferase, partial [Clostridia bacterium]|nr:CDP-diacylglycerol--glycerol-3-phosphate 3-phosphatidyltransferase [Clostridia bacterium]
MNIPNRLTILRILLVPVFIACFYIDVTWKLYLAAAVFFLAYMTDILDGQIARKQKIVTDFGKLMDPIADKLLTSSALVMLVAENLLSPIPAFIIIAREFIISGIRLVSAGNGKVIAASWLGKTKTITQCVAIIMIMLDDLIISILGFPLGMIVMWVSVLFTVWSGVDY